MTCVIQKTLLFLVICVSGSVNVLCVCVCVCVRVRARACVCAESPTYDIGNGGQAGAVDIMSVNN